MILGDLGGYVSHKPNVRPSGWYFTSDRGLTTGQRYGPWPTATSAFEGGPVWAACRGVEMATRRRDVDEMDVKKWIDAAYETEAE